MSSPSRQTLLDTTQRFLDTFTQPFSSAAALELRVPECHHYVGPSVPNVTYTDRETAIAAWADLQRLFRNTRFVASGDGPVLVDVETRTTVARVRGEADTVDGPYRHNIVFVLTMDAGGRRVEAIDEVCDSAYVAGWMAKFGDEEFKKRSLEWQAREDAKN